MSYKHMKNLEGKTGEYILRKTDGAHIPCNEGNRDYDEYLKWEAIDGNEPEAAD